MTARLIGSALGCLFAATVSAAAKEDIEFVQEHLPEVAMDNRYATLPLWSNAGEAQRSAGVDLQSAFGSTSAGTLTIDGPMFAIVAHTPLSEHWEIGGLAFYDPLRLTSSFERRDLQTLFAPSTPIVMPVAAEFSNLDGTSVDLGAGMYVSWSGAGGVLGQHRWIGGALWQRMTLEDYRFDYRLTAGPQAGLTGTIDFDATYAHIVPFAGLELPRTYDRWATNLHVLAAFPLPRRGVTGHVTGPTFDIHGDTAAVGNGKHFGDPSLTLGYTVTYRPAHLSVDLGSLLSQAVLEPWVHRGIERNILLSFSYGF